jgi:hypothetical protein
MNAFDGGKMTAGRRQQVETNEEQLQLVCARADQHECVMMMQ